MCNRKLLDIASKFRMEECMLIQRDKYVQQLIKKQWNGRIKVICGLRRCGKSTVLFELFKDHLIREGVPQDHIIALALDTDINSAFRDPEALSAYVHEKASDPDEKYYVFLDEIQYAISREELKNPDKPVRIYSVLNGFLQMKNIDVYVTGSNSKLLSKDISTEFRGRGDVVNIYPLSFKEFYEASGMEKRDAYDEYMTYGGMPYLLSLESDEEKYDYLDQLFEEIYFKDIEERYDIKLPGVLRDMTSCLCSSTGSLTNASKLARTVNSTKNVKTDSETISLYLSYLTDSFLFQKADRYDVKGKKYFEYPSKYYCTDVGLRNVRLQLRQQEETHIMENIIYNELIQRGYKVDVGVVPASVSGNGKRSLQYLEIDFIARKAGRTYYIQSALRMDDAEKEEKELRSLRKTGDSFKKIVVSDSYGKSWMDDEGILRIGLLDFLLDENSLNR